MMKKRNSRGSSGLKRSQCRRNKKYTHPGVNINLSLNRAVAIHQTGQIEKAEAEYRNILNYDPNNPDALHLLGIIASQKGDFETAVQLIQLAIQFFPTSDMYYNNLGNSLAKLNRLDEAVDAYFKALRINPESVEAINNLGANLKELGRTEEALGYFKKALKIKPDSVEIYNNMGNAYTDLGQLDAAVVCFRKAVTLKPDYAIAYNNLGSALKLQENYKEAVESYTQSLSANPTYAEACNNLGETLAEMGKPDEAIPFFEKAIDLKPGFGLAIGNLLYALTRICAWDQFKDLNSRLDAFTTTAIKEGRRPPEDPFLNLVRHDSNELQFAVAAAWSKLLVGRESKQVAEFDFHARDDRHRRIVIGYLSNNYHDHPMAHLITGLLSIHNRNAFKIICFSSGRDDGSEYRSRVIKACDHFIDIRHMNHQDAARCIYDAEVDILVDLMGYTKGHRLEICARRPAPVQARYLGFAGTTGARFVDYLIADEMVVPETHFPYYSEKIVHLPYCYQVNDQEQQASTVVCHRSDYGLPDHAFIFCSFNQPYKIEPVIFSAWMRILSSVPGSVLWLQGGNPVAEKNLRQSADLFGIGNERIIFANRVKKADHLKRLEYADLALDTRMVSGAATTSDALWAGVPVISLTGNHFSSRMAASILKTAGFPELAVDSLDDYCKLAISLSQDSVMLSRMKRSIKDNLLKTPLFDTKRFAGFIEHAYDRMWEIFCSKKEPEHFMIRDI